MPLFLFFNISWIDAAKRITSSNEHIDGRTGETMGRWDDDQHQATTRSIMTA